MSIQRKLQRQNTIHLRGTCPKCGRTNIKFYKDLIFASKLVPNEHNKWYCKRCRSRFNREELKDVYYV